MPNSTRMYKFSAPENLARLRVRFKGEAKETVTALLYMATNPSVIMNTLERCFGSLELTAGRTVDELRPLPHPGDAGADLNNLAVKLQNAVCILGNVDNKGYLLNPTLVRDVTKKLHPHVRTRWCDYAEEHYNSFLSPTDRTMRFAYARAVESQSKSRRCRSRRQKQVITG